MMAFLTDLELSLWKALCSLIPPAFKFQITESMLRYHLIQTKNDVVKIQESIMMYDNDLDSHLE